MKAKVEIAFGRALNRVLRIGGGHVIEADWTGVIGTVDFIVRKTHGSGGYCYCLVPRVNAVQCLESIRRRNSMVQLTALLHHGRLGK